MTGCAIAIPPPREPVSDDARRAVALLLERWHAFSDLKTLADVVVERGGDRAAVTAVVLAKAPASVRFEALSPMGQPLLVATIAEGRLTTYDTTTNVATVGPATAESAARLLSLPFDPDQLVGVLAGLAVPPRDLRVAEVMPPDDAGPSVNLIGAVHRERIWMDFETGVVRQLDITGGRIEARIVFERAPDGRLAGFSLTAAQGYLSGSIRYRQPVIGGGVDGERFNLALPQNARVQRFD